MSGKLIKLEHLLMALERQNEQNARLAIAVTEAIEELAAQTVTIEQVTTAINAAMPSSEKH